MTSPRKPAAKKTTKAAPRRRAVSVLPAPPSTPEPLRPLGQEGRRLWDRIWEMRNKWISRSVDLDHVTMLCESIDERVALRVKVLRDNEWRDRVALRSLDQQIMVAMGLLGLNPSERNRLNVGEQQTDESDPLARMRARYASGRRED